MARLKRGLGALQKWFTFGLVLGLLKATSAQETTPGPPSCDSYPSPDTVDSVASMTMTRTTEKGVSVTVNRTFAFYMCRAPGFVFNFPPDFPLVNQFALWCEDRRPGVWIPSDNVPRCQPESVKAATSVGSTNDEQLATLYLFNMAMRGTVAFLDINKLNNTLGSAGLSHVRIVFNTLEKSFNTSNPENLAPAIADVAKNIFSRKDTIAYDDLLKSAIAAQIANDPNAAASSGKLYGQSSDAKTKKIYGTVGALIGAGVFIAIFMLCTIMSRIRGYR